MGNQNRGSYALVSMTNGDIYYISVEFGNWIQTQLTRESDKTTFIETTDVRSGAEIMLAVNQISSIVVKGGQDV